MQKIINKLQRRLGAIFSAHCYETQVERYVQSRYPKSAADIEHLIREFNYKQTRSLS